MYVYKLIINIMGIFLIKYSYKQKTHAYGISENFKK